MDLTFTDLALLLGVERRSGYGWSRGYPASAQVQALTASLLYLVFNKPREVWERSGPARPPSRARRGQYPRYQILGIQSCQAETRHGPGAPPTPPRQARQSLSHPRVTNPPSPLQMPSASLSASDPIRRWMKRLINQRVESWALKRRRLRWSQSVIVPRSFVDLDRPDRRVRSAGGEVCVKNALERGRRHRPGECLRM